MSNDPRPIVLPESPDSDGPAEPDDASELVADALAAPPSPGTAGRMELLHHWGRLTPENRIMLLHLARGMGGRRWD